MLIHRSVAKAVLVALSCALPCMAADWPMWRYDANHSAASPEELPAELHLQWQRVMHVPRPAFPEDMRLCVDISYEPVAMGNMLFVPSMVTDSVAAIDTASGAVKWRFYTAGPVRFAPVAWQGKVYFASDDGNLYCVHAPTGTLAWTFNGLSEDRQAHRLLGNGRVVSRWPARGGPVIANGTVYFAKGFWPNEGVFVYALDAETGKRIWANDELGWIKDGLIDHGLRRDAGLSPLGYLTVMGDKLVVPSGRSFPAFLDRRAGKMEPYSTGWGGRDALAKGCWHQSGINGFLFQGGDVHALDGEAAAVAGPFEPKEYYTFEEFVELSGATLKQVEAWAKKELLEEVARDGKRMIRVRKRPAITWITWWLRNATPGEQHYVEKRPRIQVDPANRSELGIFREAVLTGDTMYYSMPIRNTRGRGGLWPDYSYSGIEAYDLTDAKWGVLCRSGWGTPRRFVLWPSLQFKQRWRLDTDLKVQIKAGSRLYAGAPGKLAAVQIPTNGQEPRIVWQAEIEGTPHRMIAADGKLFVVTQEGSLYCFGGSKTRPELYAVPPAKSAGGSATKTAARILAETRVQEGYCLTVGTDDGKVIEELALQSRLHVVALEPDVAKADALRRSLGHKGMYGERVHVLHGDLSSLRLSPYWASLAVVTDTRVAGDPARMSALFDVLRPHGGVACLLGSQSVSIGQLANAEVKRRDGMTLVVRAGAMPGSDEWTHESANAGNTFSTAEANVKPPFGVLWFGGTVDTIFPSYDYTHSRGPFALIRQGRMFAITENVVHATDVYTGRHLWKIDLPKTRQTKLRRRGHMVYQRDTAENFVAAQDALYVISKRSCLVLDPATGAQIGSIEIPKKAAPAGKGNWEEIRLWDDCFIAAIGYRICRLDRRTGELLWHVRCQRDRFRFALGSGKVFCVDYWLPERKRRGEDVSNETTIMAIDINTGKKLWQTTSQVPEDKAKEAVRKKLPPLNPTLSYRADADVLVLTATRSILGAYRGSTGEALWTEPILVHDPPNKFSGPEPPILLKDKLITHSGFVVDLQTGKQIARYWRGSNSGTRGCNRAVANEHVITLRDAHASYFDVATGEHSFFRAIRSGCTNSLLPASGILNAPNFAHGCACNWALFMSYAMMHMPEAEEWRPR